MFAALLLITFCVFTGHSKSFSLKQETALRSENARLQRTNSALLKALKAMTSENSVGGPPELDPEDYMCTKPSECTENYICIDGASPGDYCVGPIKETKQTIERWKATGVPFWKNGAEKSVGGAPSWNPTNYICDKHDDCVDGYICAKGATLSNFCVAAQKNTEFFKVDNGGYYEDDPFAEAAVGSPSENPENYVCSKHDDCREKHVCATGVPAGNYCVGPVELNQESFERHGH